MCFFKRKDKPIYTLSSLEKAQAILEDRYSKKMVSDEYYRTQSVEFAKQKELLQKQNNK